MKRLSLILTCLLCFFVYGAAESKLKTAVSPLAPRIVIRIEHNSAVLHWSRLSGQWTYQVIVADAPDMTDAEVIAAVSDTFFVHDISTIPDFSTRFYAIIAQRYGNALDEADYDIIEDFEDMPVLHSYSEEEDIDAEGWTLIGEGAGQPLCHSLELSGNTWKRQFIVPNQVIEDEVWRIVVRSMSESRIQAFGIADSANELWYQLWGEDAVDAEGWNASNTGWFPEEEWLLIDLPVAEDWYGRFGYFPRVLELLYANDNDENTDPGVFQIDEIRDLSAGLRDSQPLEIEWSIIGQPYPDSVTVVLSVTGTEGEHPPVSYAWTLGDGCIVTFPALIHRYATDASYKVVLQYREYDGQTGWATAEVVCGNGSSSREFNFISVGDVMIARRYETGGLIDSIGTDGIFAQMRPTIESANLAMCNLECPFTNWPHDHPTKEFTFKGLPEYLPAVPNAGFDYCALGNNHNLDYMYPGMVETQFLLDSLGILSSGSGMNDLVAREPAIFSKNGVTAAILSYCNRDGADENRQPFLNATRSRPGFAMWNRTQIEQTIPAATELADLVIVQSHSGTEYATEETSLDESLHGFNPEYMTFELIPDTADVDLRHYAIDMGADIVINHHPHVIQGIETYHGKIIAHSMGNFAFDQTFFETFYTMALRARCSAGNGIADIEVLPLFIQGYVPNRTSGYLAARILDYVADLSRPMSTIMVRDTINTVSHILLDSPYNPRTSVLDTTVSLAQRDTIWISDPIWIAGDNYPVGILLPDSLHDVEVRIGREILWLGNFEAEGADPWLFNSEDESYSEVNPHSGARCGLVSRSVGALMENGTLMANRIPMAPDCCYTAQCWISTENANHASLSIRYYNQRTTSVSLSAQIIGDEIDGTTPWTFYWDELDPHDNTSFYNIWFATRGQMLQSVEARFDDIEIVRWEDWQPLGAEIPFPSNVTHVQLRSLSERNTASFELRTQWIPISSSFPNGG